MPTWYLLVRASRYSNGAWTPEDLAMKPTFWLRALLTAEAAEADAEAEAHKQAERQNRTRRGRR